MKYCPYCGADLVDGAVSFCAECGKPLKTEKDMKNPVKKDDNKKTKRLKQKKLKENSLNENVPSTQEENDPNEDYDGYYDDVTPKDSVMLHQGLDKTMVKKLVILIGCVIIAIALCVVALVLLS